MSRPQHKYALPSPRPRAVTDLEVVLSLLTILGAIVLLSLAHDAVEGWRRVGGSENGRGVEGHAPATRLGTERTKGMCAAVVSAARTGDADAIPAARDRVTEPMVGAGIKPGRPFSEPPRLDHPALVPANRRRGGISGEGDTQPNRCPESVNGGGGLSQGGPPPSLGDIS